MAVSGVSRAQKDELLADYDLATRAVLYVVELKFAVWLQLPLIWCGLGHPDEGTARECGKSGKNQWLATQDSAAHHHCTLALLVIEGAIRDQFTLFLNGTSRSDLPELHTFIKPLRLVRTNELSVERLHKDSTHAAVIGPTTSAVFMSQSLRIDEVTSPHIGGLNAIADAADLVRSEEDVLQQFQLNDHEAVMAWRDIQLAARKNVRKGGRRGMYK